MRALILCLLLIPAAAPEALADGKGGAGDADAGADVEKAKELFSQAVAEFKEGKHAQALEDFRLSYELRPHWRLHLNMGLCYKELAMFSEARAELEAFLEEGEGQIDKAELELVEDAIADLESITAVLEIALATDGALVEMDGKDVTGQALAGTIVVDPGAHVLEASLEGYEPMRQELIVSKGETRTIEIALVPLAAAGPVEPASGGEGKEAKPSGKKAGAGKGAAAFWVMGSITLALAAGSVATGVLTLGKNGEVRALDGDTDELFDAGGYSEAAYEDYLDERRPLVKQGKVLGYATTALMAAAGAALAATIVAGVVTKPFAKHAEEPAVALSPVPLAGGGGMLVVGGAF